jgi:hypothetical protein
MGRLERSWVAGLPVLPGITQLTLLVDNDANGVGQKSCRQLQAHLDCGRAHGGDADSETGRLGLQ